MIGNQEESDRDDDASSNEEMHKNEVQKGKSSRSKHRSASLQSEDEETGEALHRPVSMLDAVKRKSKSKSDRSNDNNVEPPSNV